MNLLFAIDDNFCSTVRNRLTVDSFKHQVSGIQYLCFAENRLTKEAELAAFCKHLKMAYHPVMVKQSLFENAPVTDRYPTTIYYRLLAHQMLPQDLHKILYLDADILCINDLSPLYSTALGNNLFASAIHASLTNTTDVINKIRLQNFGADGYYNSGCS